jgi:sulfur carrier protein
VEPTTSDITVRLNGSERSIPSELTLDGLLRHIGRDPAVPGVAVAVNDAVVRRNDWPATSIAQGDRIEVITASQGG